MRRRHQLQLCVGVTLMSFFTVAVPMENVIETETVEDTEFSVLEQALLLAERGDKNELEPRSPLNFEVSDVEECGSFLQGGALAGPHRTRTRPNPSPLQSPLELLSSRGRSAIFVTEICSQVLLPIHLSSPPCGF